MAALIGPKRPEMAINGAQKSYILNFNGKLVILFSDETHGIVECFNKEGNYHPVVSIEDYLKFLSYRVNATLYLESSNRNQWAYQGKSHMENIYLLCRSKKCNKFDVKHVDERYTGTSINELIKMLLEKTEHKGVQKLFDIASTGNFAGYKKIIDFALKRLDDKFEFEKLKQLYRKRFDFEKLVDIVLRVCFKDVKSFYKTHESALKIEQQKFESGELQELTDEHKLFEFMASFFMCMVELPFFIYLIESKKPIHLGFFGSQHIDNILNVFKKWQVIKDDIKEFVSIGNCLVVTEINKRLRIKPAGEKK